MTDPLAQVVSLLQPSPSLSKLVVAAGTWAVRRTDDECPFYCALLEGSCRLAVDGETPIVLEAGDFILMPAAGHYTVSSLAPPPAGAIQREPVSIGPGLFRLGNSEDVPNLHMLVGHCAFASSDAGLLVSLLPRLIHVRGERRLTTVVTLLDEELHGDRPGREVVLARLLEVLLIEALRSARGPAASPGLLRGLLDERLASALRHMHAEPTRDWAVSALAKAAALSRSTFFERFRREVGVAPMEYLLGWRMALAKDLLRRSRIGVAQVAERVGYSSGSTFSVAFSRHVGISPALYARNAAAS